MKTWGSILLLIAGGLLFAGLTYDTTVFAMSGNAVNNIGLMHNQSMILGASGFAFLGGLILLALGSRAGEGGAGDLAKTPYVRALNCIMTNNMDELLAELRKPDLHLNSTDESGLTLLHHAVAKRNYEAVKALVDRNARKDLIDSQGRRAIDLAGDAPEGVRIRKLLEII